MSNEQPESQAASMYREAHNLQYGAKNLRAALDIYMSILSYHAESSEAKYALSQIQNIVTSVVPKEDLLNTHVKLVNTILDQNAPP